MHLRLPVSMALAALLALAAVAPAAAQAEQARLVRQAIDVFNAISTMPDREVAAILPRSVLVGAPTRGRRGSARVPLSLLGTIGPILTRMAEGRVVRLWDYNGRNFFSFLPWKSVRFVADPPGPAAAPEP